MTPFEQGYFAFRKAAGIVDELQNMRRASRGEVTDQQMAMAGAGTAAGAVFAPQYAEHAMGLIRPSELQPENMGRLGKATNFYTGTRVPGVEYDRLARVMEEAPTEEGASQVRNFLRNNVEAPPAARMKNVLRQSISDLPTHLKRHPILAGIGALGLAGTVAQAGLLGKGIHERYLGGAQGLGWDDAAIAAGGLGALGAVGAAGGGLYEANRRGMLPKVQITMPQGMGDQE